MQIKTVSLIGMGALGILFGRPLSRALPKGDFRVIASPERIARYTAGPILANGEACDFAFITPNAALPPADLVLVAVKATALQSAIRDMAGQVGPHTVILSLLNGISSEEELSAVWPGQVVWAVALGMDATRTGQALVYRNMGSIQFGELDGEKSERVRAVAALFEAAGIPHQVHPDIRFAQWRKLMVNVGLNQASAVCRVPYGGLQAPGPARDTMIAAMREVLALAPLEGVPLTEQLLTDWLAGLGDQAADGMPSMLQDVLAKRPTEVELFSGTVRRLAAKHGLATPVNDRLYERIRAIEAGY